MNLCFGSNGERALLGELIVLAAKLPLSKKYQRIDSPELAAQAMTKERRQTAVRVSFSERGFSDDDWY